MPTICGLARGEREDLRAAAADDERRMRLLHRLRLPVELGHPVVLAVERERAVGEEPLEDRDRLREPRDAHAGAVERHAGLLVVGGHPARADAELEPAVGEQVERAGLACEHDRVLVVVAEHERADAQRVGDGGGVRRARPSARAGGRRSDRARTASRYPSASARRASSVNSFAGRGVLRDARRSGTCGRGAPASRCHGVPGAQRPVEPQPPRPRSVSSSASTSRHSTCSTRWITSCAMRSPRWTVERLAGRCSRAAR